MNDRTWTQVFPEDIRDRPYTLDMLFADEYRSPGKRVTDDSHLYDFGKED